MDDYICVRCEALDDNIGMSGLCDACENGDTYCSGCLKRHDPEDCPFRTR